MKNTVLSILFVLSNLLTFSQIHKDAVAFEDPEFNEYLKTRKVPIVKGKISNISLEEIKKTSISYTIVTVLGGEGNNKTTSINSDGTFSLELETNLPYQQIWLKIGTQFYAGIYAHEELFIEIDWQKAKAKKIYMIGDGVNYLGKDGELNMYLNKHVLFQQSYNRQIQEALNNIKFGREAMKIPLEKYMIKYDSLFVEIKKIDSLFIIQNPSKYEWILENERMSEYYGGICTKYWYSKKMESGLWDKVVAHKTHLVTNSGMLFNRYLHTLISSNATDMRGKGVDFFLKYFCENEKEKNEFESLILLVKNTSPKDSVLYKENMMNQGKFMNNLYQKSESRVLYPRVMTYLDSAFVTSKADFIKLFEDGQRQDIKIRKMKIEIALASMKTDWCKDMLTDEYQKTLSKIKEVDDALAMSSKATTKNNIGELILETPFSAKLYEVKSGKGTELLANLKSSFQGKALLLDFWGTWCAPCLSDLPHSKKLHDESPELPIEYIYLCTSNNSTIEKWKNKIAELEIPGTHIFVDERIENELMELFQATGYPSYRFIDKMGKYKPGAINWMQETDKAKLKALVEGK
ncbi:MAG: TlpA disulfide reductase family protein [Bacteroidota bacterium]